MDKSAGIALELKELDTNKRTGVIMHSVYGSIDLAGDISTKGMFSKSWQETKTAGVAFLFNHIAGQKVGVVTKLYDDDAGAYTEVKFANTTLGNDVLEMAGEGMLEGASYGYITVKKENTEVKSRKVRKLLEVKHKETSLLTVAPCHPDAGLQSYTKAWDDLNVKMLSDDEQGFLQALVSSDLDAMQALIMLAPQLNPDSDLYTWVMYQISRRADATSSIMSQLSWNAAQMASMKSHVEKVDSYLRKAKASDESIILLSEQNNEYKKLISEYDTAFTGHANQPDASGDEIKAMLMRINIALAV